MEDRWASWLDYQVSNFIKYRKFCSVYGTKKPKQHIYDIIDIFL